MSWNTYLANYRLILGGTAFLLPILKAIVLILSSTILSEIIDPYLWESLAVNLVIIIYIIVYFLLMNVISSQRPYIQTDLVTPREVVIKTSLIVSVATFFGLIGNYMLQTVVYSFFEYVQFDLNPLLLLAGIITGVINSIVIFNLIILLVLSLNNLLDYNIKTTP
jgi:hypothetical protein